MPTRCLFHSSSWCTARSSLYIHGQTLRKLRAYPSPKTPFLRLRKNEPHFTPKYPFPIEKWSRSYIDRVSKSLALVGVGEIWILVLVKFHIQCGLNPSYFVSILVTCLKLQALVYLTYHMMGTSYVYIAMYSIDVLGNYSIKMYIYFKINHSGQSRYRHSLVI